MAIHVDVVASADPDNNIITVVPLVVDADSRMFVSGRVRALTLSLLAGIRTVSTVDVAAEEIGPLTSVTFCNPRHLRGMSVKLTATPYSGSPVSVVQPIKVEDRTRFVERVLMQPAGIDEDDDA